MSRLGRLIKALFYLFSVSILWLVLRALFRLRVYGRRNIPKDGAILIARHRSYWDIPLLAVAVGGRQQIRFVARKTLMRNPALAILIRLYAIPIDRESFRLSDYRRVLAAIEARELVGIFPEGTTKGAKGPKIGVARFAERTGQKILPVRLVAHGPYPPHYPFHFPRVEVRFGRPFHLEELARALPPWIGREERYERLSLMLMERIDQVEREG
jgi:1-acyl-sn-glycerol-3-phosphate acyltransferase